MRSLAVLGFALLALAFVVFIVGASDRPFPYVPVQTVAIAGSLLLIAGVIQASDLWLAIGFGIEAAMRLAQLALGLSKLGTPLNLLLAAGWVWACVNAGRGRSVRAALWFLAFVHTASLVFSLGRFTAAVGLALASAGLFLAAPNMGGPKGSASVVHSR